MYRQPRDHVLALSNARGRPCVSTSRGCLLSPLATAGELHYYITFQGSPATYTVGLPMVQQVLDSFKWTPPPADK